MEVNAVHRHRQPYHLAQAPGDDDDKGGKVDEIKDKAKEHLNTAKDKAKEGFDKAKNLEAVKKLAEKTGMGAGAIVGIILGLLIGIPCCIAIGFCIYKATKSKPQGEAD